MTSGVRTPAPVTDAGGSQEYAYGTPDLQYVGHSVKHFTILGHPDGVTGMPVPAVGIASGARHTSHPAPTTVTYPSPAALAATLAALGFDAHRADALSGVHPALLLVNPDAYAATPEESRCLRAVRELASAYVASRPVPETVVKGPADVAAAIGDRLRNLPVEQFGVVLLATNGAIVHVEMLTQGGLAGTVCEPRAVFRCALAHNAASIVLVHNHPSGSQEPSREDVRVTKQLAEAGKTFGIPVQDHVIIAGDGFTSLAERGLM